ncbi:MAG: hypothetical protein JSS27_09285 [Planctomycetes bacterium]|nr:hypothetical protein [Planctomycetota bacterium]
MTNRGNNDGNERRTEGGVVIKAIIFDLDNCLCAADAAGRQLLEAVFAVIRSTNDGTYSAAEVSAIIGDLWRQPLNVVAEKYQFPPEMRAAAWAAYARAEVSGQMAGCADIPTAAPTYDREHSR